MGTYQAMQDRIADELGQRSDLSSQIKLAIQTAIAKWEREQFYFNQLRTPNVFNTVSGQEFYTSADNANIGSMAKLNKVTVLVNSNRYTLNPRTADYLEDISVNPAVKSYPFDYAYYAESLRLYPIPSGVYPITLMGTQRLSTLVNGTDSNAWTTDAEALIRCEAKMDVYLNILQQPDLAQLMAFQIYGNPSMPGSRGYLYDLRAETANRQATPKIRPTYF